MVVEYLQHKYDYWYNDIYELKNFVIRLLIFLQIETFQWFEFWIFLYYNIQATRTFIPHHICTLYKFIYCTNVHAKLSHVQSRVSLHRFTIIFVHSMPTYVYNVQLYMYRGLQNTRYCNSERRFSHMYWWTSNNKLMYLFPCPYTTLYMLLYSTKRINT